MPFKDKEKQKEAQRRWYLEVAKPRREQWIKEHGPCARCGSWENLQVDHVDRVKKVSHRIWTWAEERRNVELVKCQVLCEICHYKKTNEDFQEGFIVHGNVNRGYQNGCRCDECKAANTSFKKVQDRRSGRGTNHRKKFGMLGESARPRFPVTEEITG